MGILNLFKNKGIACYQRDKFNLDNILLEEYQDDGEEYKSSKIFERQNTDGSFIYLEDNLPISYFKYFLDGSRYTYKVGDIETTDGKFMPVVAGQIAAGVTRRENGFMKKDCLKRKNYLLVYNKINKEDFKDIKKIVESQNYYINGVSFIMDQYNFKNLDGTRPENFAIAKIQERMRALEIDIVREMVQSHKLGPSSVLAIDGSLQFIDQVYSDRGDDSLFRYVIGISKSFNPNLQAYFKNNQHIGHVLTRLKYRHRTPVYHYPLKNSNKKIGVWYIRIRPRDYMKNALDGIVKVEKLAVDLEDKELGFETGLIDNISKSILLERNVTCYGKDSRWANHLYPIYVTEMMLKQSFLSATYFLNLF